MGIGQENPQEQITAGQNAFMTFSVDNLEQVKSNMIKKWARCEGAVLEIPGHIKMQTVIYHDGNRFQICQLLESGD